MNPSLLRYGIPAALGAVAGGATGAEEGGFGGAVSGAALGAGLGTLGMGLARASFPQAGKLAGRFAPVLQSGIESAVDLGRKGVVRAQRAVPESAINDPESIRRALIQRGDKLVDDLALAGLRLTPQQVTNIGSTALGAGSAVGGIQTAQNIMSLLNQPAIDPENPYVSQNPRGLGMTTMQYV